MRGRPPAPAYIVGSCWSCQPRRAEDSTTRNTPLTAASVAVLEQNAPDLAKGEKTLAYFVFKGAKFGGTLTCLLR